MKMIVAIFFIFCISSCTVVDSSNFEYLDDDDLELRPLLVIGVERDIKISLPKSLAIELPETLFLKPESLELPYLKVLGFPYEWLWGGPINKDEGLYLFDLAIDYKESGNLLSLDVDTRIQNIRGFYEEFDEGHWRDYVLNKLVVEKYQSENGYEWVMDNHPTVMRFHEYFTLPISDERELVVWFWYNEDWVKDHPEWFERRKALSRRILDSVKISGLKPSTG